MDPAASGSGRPLVTVVVPTYNRAHLLGRALESIRDQTFTDWECLVVDDASTDDSAAVVRAMGDPRFRYSRHESNRGASAARNTGIAAARGEYVGFLDSDDEWLPKKLEKQLSLFEKDPAGRVGAVVCGRILVTESGSSAVPGPALDGSDGYRLFVTRGLGGLGAYGYLVRRSVLASPVRFDESFPTCEDRDFLAQVARSFAIASLEEPLMRQYRDDADDHLWGGAAAAMGLSRLIDKYHADLTRWPSDLARLHRSAGIKHLLAGDGRSARRHLAAALLRRPLQPGAYVWFLASLGGPRLAGRFHRLRAGTAR